MSDSLYGLAALRRYRERGGLVEGCAEPVPVVEPDDQPIVLDDDDGDDFDDLFDAWVDHNMEVSG